MATKYANWCRRNKVPSEDATEEMVLKVTKWDNKRARPGCPHGCVLALKLELEPGIKQAHFYNKVAHLLMYCPRRNRMINFRYSLDEKTRDAIKNFDPPNYIPFPTDTYVLRVIARSSSNSLAAKKRRDKNRKNKNHRNIGKKVKYSSPQPKSFERMAEQNWPFDYSKIAKDIGQNVQVIP